MLLNHYMSIVPSFTITKLNQLWEVWNNCSFGRGRGILQECVFCLIFWEWETSNKHRWRIGKSRLQTWHLWVTCYYNYKCSAQVSTVKSFSRRYSSQSSFQFLQSEKTDQIPTSVLQGSQELQPHSGGVIASEPTSLLAQSFISWFRPQWQRLGDILGGLLQFWEVVLSEKDTSWADATFHIKFPCEKAVCVPYSYCFI